MKNQIFTLLLMLLSGSWVFGQAETFSFNQGWKFSKTEFPEGVHDLNFDDSRWDPVLLPHDWAIAGPFDPEMESGNTGKLPWRGVGWYRRVYEVPLVFGSRRLYLEFDGVMAKSEIFVNGQLAGSWDYGYTSFIVDITDLVIPGEPNVLVVRADTTDWGSRWYPGAGIYRKVTLHTTPFLHFAHWGVFARAEPTGDGSLSYSLEVGLELQNFRDFESEIELRLEVLDPEGESVATDAFEASLAAGTHGTFVRALELKQPRLWDVDNPNVYSVRAELWWDERRIDSRDIPLGFRTFAFTADDGFHLNGRRVQIKGVNLHHDHGPLGAAFFQKAAERQLRIMKEMGVNLLRTSHNPPAPEVLEICDRLGILVWNELFDKWDHTAGRHDGEPDLQEFSARQIANWVRRDRNHPSLIVWSVANELYPTEEVTRENVAFMRGRILEEDPTRPVGIGAHIPGMVDDGIFEDLDLTGWNYGRRYARMRELYPEKPIVYSESASALSTRGFYDWPHPNKKIDYPDSFQLSSYDYHAAAWSDIPEVEFERMKRDRFVAGEIVWTGFDYLGEPTPFAEDARSSYFGIVDLVGLPKDRYFLYRSHWLNDEETLHLLPHWNWEGREDPSIPVFVYSSADEIHLFRNGEPLGIRRRGQDLWKAPNLLRNSRITATTFQPGSEPNLVADRNPDTIWKAGPDDPAPYLQVELERQLRFEFLALHFEDYEHKYAYQIYASADGKLFLNVASKPKREADWSNNTRRVFHEGMADARFVRVVFERDLENPDEPVPALRGFGVHQQRAESEYYDVMNDYRFRWRGVDYEPGTLTAVGYSNGRLIGEARVTTAGPVSKIRLTPEMTAMQADGQDLIYIQVTAHDADANPHPLADNRVTFTVEGPATLAGVGNGNPMSFEAFQDESHALFFGKAVAILRSVPGEAGEIRLTASAEGLETDSVVLRSY